MSNKGVRMRKETRVRETIHTRKIDRRIAKNNMKNAGMVQICKHDYARGIRSYFAEHWRDYVN